MAAVIGVGGWVLPALWRRIRAEQILVDGASAHVVRERETVEELFARECVPG